MSKNTASAMSWGHRSMGLDENTKRTFSRGINTLRNLSLHQSFIGGYAGDGGFRDGHGITLLCADRIVVRASYVVCGQSAFLRSGDRNGGERRNARLPVALTNTSPASPSPPMPRAGFSCVLLCNCLRSIPPWRGGIAFAGPCHIADRDRLRSELGLLTYGLSRGLRVMGTDQ